jgi:hypothetical protein
MYTEKRGKLKSSCVGLQDTAQQAVQHKMQQHVKRGTNGMEFLWSKKMASATIGLCRTHSTCGAVLTHINPAVTQIACMLLEALQDTPHSA